MIATQSAPQAQPTSFRTVSYLEPATPRRRPGRAVTVLSTRRDLSAAPAPFRIGSIEVAGRDAARCKHRSGSLRCVRGPHPDAPQAHVLVAGAPDRQRARAATPATLAATATATATASVPDVPGSICCA